MDGSSKISTEEFTERFLDLFGSFPGIVYRISVVDGQFTPIWISPNFGDVTGFSPDDVIGNADWWTSRLHPEDRATAQMNAAGIFETGAVSQEYRFQFADGSHRWIHDELRVEPANEENGPTLLLGTWSDVSAIRQIQHTEFLATRQFQAIAETTPNIITITRLSDGTITYANPAIRALAGYDPEEIIGRKSTDFYVNPQDRENLINAFGDSRIVTNFEAQLKKADGTPYWVLVNSGLVDFDDGPHLVAELTDVTEQKILTQRIMESETRFRDFVETASDWYWEMDENLRFTYLSENAFDLLGFTAQDVIGKTRRQMFGDPEVSGLSAEQWEDHLQQLENHVFFRDFRYWMIDNNGRRQHASISGKPIFDENGVFRGYRGTGRFITQLTNAMDSIRQAKEEAEAASNAKTKFLSAMSHELRTPLNAILGFAQLLKIDDTHPITEEQMEGVEHILGSGRLLLTLINDILDLSAIESGNVPMNREPVQIQKLFSHSVALIRPVADEKGIRVDLGAVDPEGLMVLADETRIKQVLLNLLSNAVKYNKPGGSVRVGARLQDDNSCWIEVADSGIGIETADLKTLFDPFARLGQLAGDIEGTGLGLALSRKLVELMDGTILVDSTPGQGSTFTVCLPLAQIQTESFADTAPEGTPLLTNPGTTLRVLYVEDDNINIHLMAGFLKRFGNTRLHVARSAELAFNILNTVPIDVILMDVHLPGMDGIEATTRIKNTPKWRHIPVVIVSANAMDLGIQRGLAAGAETYLTKPVALDTFFQVLNELLPGRVPLPDA